MPLSTLAPSLTRRLVGLLVGMAFLPVASIFVIGRLDLGYPSAVLSPWVVQCTVAFAALSVVALLARRRFLAVATLACTLWGGILALPTVVPHERVRLAAMAAEGHPQLRVLFANVCNHNAPSDEALAWLCEESPDLVGIAELTHDWSVALGPLEEMLPYTVQCTQSLHVTGVALYSRYPLREARIEQILPGASVHIEALVDHPDGTIRVFVIHPQSPRSAERAAIRNASLEAFAERCSDSSLPTIVMGDFNETPFGRPFQAFIATTGYQPARAAAGFSPSWPATYAGVRVPEALRIPIDHIVVSDDFAPRGCRIGPDIRSDHLPIVADLVMLASAEIDESRAPTKSSFGTQFVERSTEPRGRTGEHSLEEMTSVSPAVDHTAAWRTSVSPLLRSVPQP